MFAISREPAFLVLRFSAPDWEAAKRVKDRFCYEENPDRIVPLYIPAERFFTKEYRCGLRADDHLRPRDDFALLHGDRAVGYFPKDTVLEVLQGDIEYPQWVFVRVLLFPKNKAQKIECFEIHECDIQAGLFVHEPKQA
jgi:hypothetical protein